MRHLISSGSLAIACAASLAALPACDVSGADDDAMCSGAKCDIPEGPDEELCALRRDEVFNPNQQSFRSDFLRWSCSDVDGVTAEDRGQEYCEYFAIVGLPPAVAGGTVPAPAVLGRNLGEDYTFGTTETAIDLSFDQLSALEDTDSEIAGQCVFTSWNSDIAGPVPACAGDYCPEVEGLPIDEETFRMHFFVNSFEAATLLVDDCVGGKPVNGAPDDAKDTRHDDFTRGCMLNAEINDTAFRKSDSIVCAATMRVSECGCDLADGKDLSDTIAGPDRRGFPLGTWSSPTALPTGCRYVDIGDDSRTIVTCDLTGADVINYALDLKAHCQTKYGDNVVVHVPMPAAEAVACYPESSQSPYADSCSSTPWMLEPY